MFHRLGVKDLQFNLKYELILWLIADAYMIFEVLRLAFVKVCPAEKPGRWFRTRLTYGGRVYG